MGTVAWQVGWVFFGESFRANRIVRVWTWVGGYTGIEEDREGIERGVVMRIARSFAWVVIMVCMAFQAPPVVGLPVRGCGDTEEAEGTEQGRFLRA